MVEYTAFKRNIMEKRVLFELSIALILFAGIAFALPLLSPSSFSVNTSLNSFFNITVNNSEAGSVNITEVNITLPAGFNYVATSAGTTTSSSSFSNTSSILRWNNTDYVVLNVTNQSFWFNATANTTTVGTFNFTVALTNNTGVSYYNISITVNDTIAPSNVSFVRPATNNSNVSSLALNISAMDNFNVSSVMVYVYNSAGTLINNTNLTTAGRSVFAYINITNGTLVDGNYTINATAVDSSYFNNSNSTVTWRTTLDKTFPNASLVKTDSTQTVIETTYSCVDIGTGVRTCALTSSAGTVDGTDIESLECGESYTITLTATDYAGNVRTNSTSMSTDSCDGSDSTSGGGSETTTNTTWTATYTVKDADFKTGYSKEMESKTRLRFSVNGEQHTMGIISMTSTKVTINVSSTPQQATLGKGDSKKFDVDDDNFYDLLVTFNSINSSKANMTILAIAEEIEGKKVTSTSSTGSTATAANRTANSTTTAATNSTAQNKSAFSKLSSSYYKIGIMGIILGVLIVVYIMGRERGWFDRIPMFYKTGHGN